MGGNGAGRALHPAIAGVHPGAGGRGMTGYVLGRLFAAIPVLLAVTVFVFLLLSLVPGDPAVLIAGDFASPQQVEAVRQALGLNLPLLSRFLAWAGRMLSGDFGLSLFSRIPVSQLVAQRIEPTLLLSLMTITIARRLMRSARS